MNAMLTHRPMMDSYHKYLIIYLSDFFIHESSRIDTIFFYS
jgi:hypothetical protein